MRLERLQGFLYFKMSEESASHGSALSGRSERKRNRVLQVIFILNK